MSSQDTPNDVFIDRDAERPSNLLSDSRAAPEGIAWLGGDNCINEFFGRALGAGLGPAFRGEEQSVLVLSQDLSEGAVGSTASERWPNGLAGTAA